MSLKKSNSQPELTIVIPAYKEEKRIGRTLDELAIFLRNDQLLKTIAVEVLVVSADSADKTHEIVISKNNKFDMLTLLKPGPKVGKGRDVQLGMLRAKGKVVIFMDADLATPLSYLFTERTRCISSKVPSAAFELMPRPRINTRSDRRVNSCRLR